MHIPLKAATALACFALVAAPLGVAAPANAAKAVDTHEYAVDPVGDAVVVGGSKADLAEDVYEGADIGRVDVGNDEGDISLQFDLEAIQGDATIGSTTLTVDVAVKYLKGYKKTKKGKKPVFGTRKVVVENVIADPEGDDSVRINGQECYGTSAAITSTYSDYFTVTAPVACFGKKSIQGSFVFRTDGTDRATGAHVRDTARPKPISLRG